MPDLRTALGEAGYGDVATLVQSGNIVLTSPKRPSTLEREISALVLDEFGVEAATVVRTRDELEDVIERNPIPDGPSTPKLFQVTFFPGEPDAGAVEKLVATDFGNERVAVIGREAYAWHPDGIQKSKLARALGAGLGGDGTARNWNTVTKLLALADGP
jgi:uncharacterized protein (DUF1697 family)